MNHENKLNVTDDEEIACKNQLEELTEEASVAADAKMKLERDLKTAENPIKAKERDMKILRTEIKSAQKKLVSARRRLEEARKEILDNQGNAAEEERTRTRKIAETEANLARAKERMTPVTEELKKFYNEYEELEDPKKNAIEAQNGTERQLNAVKHKLRSLQSEAGNNSLTMFGPKCKALYEVRFLIYNSLLTLYFTQQHLIQSFLLDAACAKESAQIQRPRHWSSRNVFENREWKGEVCQDCRVCYWLWKS